jgi:hypothetical protein
MHPIEIVQADERGAIAHLRADTGTVTAGVAVYAVAEAAAALAGALAPADPGAVRFRSSSLTNQRTGLGDLTAVAGGPCASGARPGGPGVPAPRRGRPDRWTPRGEVTVEVEVFDALPEPVATVSFRWLVDTIDRAPALAAA